MYANLEEKKEKERKRTSEACHKANGREVALGTNLEKSSKCLVLLLHIIESYWNERIISPGTCSQVEASVCILIHLFFYVCVCAHVRYFVLCRPQKKRKANESLLNGGMTLNVKRFLSSSSAKVPLRR